MIRLVIFCCLLVTSALAEVGKVEKIFGQNEAFVLRNKSKILLTPGVLLEQGDEIWAHKNKLLILVYPRTQIILAENGKVELIQSSSLDDPKAKYRHSVIKLKSGEGRFQVRPGLEQLPDQAVEVRNVSFSMREAEFEISEQATATILNVISGQVEASSPYVQSFVPEYVKASERLVFGQRNKKFKRQKFALILKNMPEFLTPKELENRGEQKVQK